MKETILEMERYAEENNIPIIEVDSIKFIMKYIKLNNVKSVLELGTAIGYSAILMANATSTVEITTIEKDEKRYREAVKNVNKCGLDRRIECVYNDALEVNLAGHSYDLIFIDSGKAVSESFNGFKTAYKGAGEGITTKLGALKEEGIAQKNSFTGKVTENYNKAVYGTKGKIENEASKLDKEIADKQKQAKDIKDKKSPEYTKIKEEISTLKVKKAAIEEMNKKASWEEGNEIITKQNADLAQKKAELSKATTDAEKSRLNGDIETLETQIKTGKEVLARRTREAQYIQDQINNKQKTIDSINKQDKPDTAKIAKLNKEIEELKGRQDFELPNGVTKEQVKTSNDNLAETKKQSTDATNKYNELNAESSTNDRAYAQLEKAEQKANALKNKLEKEQAENDILNTKYNVQEGTGYDHVAREIGTIAYENPAARWLTVGIAGRQFGNKSEYADLYSQLTAQEKAYFKSLPEEQKATILAQYNQIVA